MTTRAFHWLHGVLGLTFLPAGLLRAQAPPAACSGGESFQFEVQGSINGGGTWSSTSAWVYGRLGSVIQVMARTRMTVSAGQTQGWSFSLKHDDAFTSYYGGAVTLNAVTTAGTQTATVQNGSPPDSEGTAVRAGFKGYTQGVVIDNNQNITLGPTSNFVSSLACYTITMPSYAGTYELKLNFTHDIGSPSIRSVVTQQGLSNVPCAKNFSFFLYVHPYASITPGGCGFSYSAQASGGLEEAVQTVDPQGGEPPPQAQGGPCPPSPLLFRRGDATGSGTVDISDAIFIFGWLFLTGAAPPCKEASDINNDDLADISDGIYLLGFLFLGTPPPPHPFPACGLDHSVSFLGCNSYPASCSINASQLSGDQSETAVAIKPTGTPQTVAIVANLWSQSGVGPGLRYSRSTSGGVQFTASTIFATPDPPSPPPNHHFQAFADPSVAFDAFGNLYVSYLPAALNRNTVEVAVSTDGGSTFGLHRTIPGVGFIDQPTIAAGPGLTGSMASIWVTVRENVTGGFRIIAAGATMTSAGALSSSFAIHPVTVDPSSPGCSDNPLTEVTENCYFHYGDIAVGPQGEVVVTYQDKAWPIQSEVHCSSPTSADPTGIFVHYRPAADPLDTLVPFGPAALVATSEVCGWTGGDDIPPTNYLAVSGPVLAWDRRPQAQGGGRLYLAYLDEAPDESNDTRVLVIFSDSPASPSSWSQPLQVTDDCGFSQFHHDLDVDQSTGYVALAWYDAREDPGNVRVKFYASHSTDRGLSFAPNFAASTGLCIATQTLPGGGTVMARGVIGDYTGIAYDRGVFFPAWGDNAQAASDAEVLTAKVKP